MIDMWAEVKETLENPEVVVRSARLPETSRIYHKWFEDTPIGSKWVRVIANFLVNGDAFVATAYADSQVIAGEVIWRRENG